MLYEIFKFEIQYRAKRLDTYLYFTILFLFSLVAINFVYEGIDLGKVKENSPSVIAFTMTVVSAILMMIISMVMGVTVLRDFQYKMESFMFINPIKKRDYLLGRFFGAFVILLFIFSGLLFGMILSEFMPWRDEERLLAFNSWYYIQPFITIVLPTLFYGSAIFFISGALSRNLLVVYTQGIFFFLVMIMAQSIDNRFFSAILDPFALEPIRMQKEFWTISELNSFTVPMNGILLYNRLFWVLTGLVTLVIGYIRFHFTVLGTRTKKTIKADKAKKRPGFKEFKIPAYSLDFTWKTIFLQLKSYSVFYFNSILKERSFLVILISAMIIVFINGIQLGTQHGVDSYPTSYIIVRELFENSAIFFFIIFIFFSADLVWKERDLKFNQVHDALPVPDLINLTGKFIALNLVYILIIMSLIFSGILFQSLNGYYNYELDVYFKSFFLEIFPYFILYSLVAFFIQLMFNHKYLGQVFTVLFIVFSISLQGFGIDHGLLVFGASNLTAYSDMNGYGHFLGPYFLFKFYWFLFSVFLFLLGSLFSVRDSDSRFRNRIKFARRGLNKNMLGISLSILILFVLTACYIFYNTNILNTYLSPSGIMAYRAAYEKSLKKYEYIPQPKIIDIKLKIDLYPKERSYVAEGYYLLKNTEKKAIDEIHIQKYLDKRIDINYVNFEGLGVLRKEYPDLAYKIYHLNESLEPDDSLMMEFKQVHRNVGFDERPNTQILYNGTYFDNYLLPGLGYNNKYELRDERSRRDFGLGPRPERPKRDNKRELRNARNGDDGYQVRLDLLLSTDSGQTAISSGNLLGTWSEKGRRYFHYKTDQAIINFFPVASARYELMRDKWQGEEGGEAVDLEIYYHKGHDYNLKRMMRSMKASLDYFSKEFSPYQYKQMRIVEVPHYLGGAVSLPNTILYTEDLGFIMNVNDEKDVDMPFFVTAHEMAHQWWGLQVAAANVQGRGMILESLSQYSALMVMKQYFPGEKIRQFLKEQQDYYLRERNREKSREVPLALTEKHKYIHYGKGALALYALQDHISEDSVNLALRRFIRDWGFKGEKVKERYATTEDLLGYFREVCPKRLDYLIDDLFNRIILFGTKVAGAVYRKKAEDLYELDLELEARKFEADSLGAEREIPLNDWIDIAVYAEGPGSKEELLYLKKHYFDKPKKRLTIRLDEKTPGLDGKVAGLNRKVVRVVVDPMHLLIDRKPEDNVKEVTLKH